MELIFGYLNIIGIICILLIVNKQIIGANSYNIYGPLLLAGVVSYQWFPLGSIVITLGVLYLVQQFAYHLIKLLYGSQILKEILTIWITVLLTISIHLIYTALEGDSTLMIMVNEANFFKFLSSVLILIFATSKVFSYHGGKFERERLSHIARFFLLSYLIVHVFQSKLLLGLASGNLWMTVGITLLIILLGSYNGLQLTEFVRFRKLIWKSLSQSKFKR